MDVLPLLRMIGALGLLLGLMTGALWAVRRYDIKLPGRIGGAARRRVELIERVSLDAKRSVALIRRDGREHLVLLAPEGAVLLEGGIVPEAPARPFAEQVEEVRAGPVPEPVAVLLGRLRERFEPHAHA